MSLVLRKGDSQSGKIFGCSEAYGFMQIEGSKVSATYGTSNPFLNQRDCLKPESENAIAKHVYSQQCNIWDLVTKRLKRCRQSNLYSVAAQAQTQSCEFFNSFPNVTTLFARHFNIFASHVPLHGLLKFNSGLHVNEQLRKLEISFSCGFDK